MQMKISEIQYDGEALKRVYENPQWTVGIKNWKPANDIEQIGNLERHNCTDELFVLLNGSCSLVYATEEGAGLDIKIVEMRPYAVYQIPPTLWHNTIMTKEAKLILIENSDTSMENSDLRDLTKEEVSFLKNQIK
ncbi:cupin [Lacrimispora sp. AGF001]|uniref:cupin n=1 Tax=Lacrimispora sp. AGF001 TaxID=3401631 RepID=UPI003B42F090